MAPEILPPGPRWPAPLLMARWLYAPRALLDACARRHGDTFSLRLWRLSPLTVVVHHPDDVRAVFAASAEDASAADASGLFEPFVGRGSLFLLDGDAHRQARQLLRPSFCPRQAMASFDTIAEVVSHELAGWGRHVRLYPALRRIALEVLVRVLFGPEGAAELASFRDDGARLLALCSRPDLLVPALRIDLGPASPWGRARRLLGRLDARLRSRIAAVRRAPAGRSDLLATMVTAGLSDQAIRDQLVTLLIAGSETTAASLAWCFAELGRHPEAMAALRREIADLGGVTAAGAGEARWLDAVVKETLRLHPVISNAVRMLRRPLALGRWRLPAGAEVAPASYLTHRRADLYAEPLRFAPERFVGHKPAPHTFYPFGGGGRRCLGQALATYQMKVVLALITEATVWSPRWRRVRPVRRALMIAPSSDLPIYCGPAKAPGVGVASAGRASPLP